MEKGNREYKSDVFSMLMEYPENALSLYNAINHSNYDDPSAIEMTKLDRGVSLTVRNDASFILDAQLSIYEHQSTVCPNMPIRSLLYYTYLIDDRFKDHNIYGKTLVKFPTPHFAVFYNGNEDQPEVRVMKLSDSYEKTVENPELELFCTVYNINKGKNKELLTNCLFLREYMAFVDYVRAYHRENGYTDLKEAIYKAIDRCMDEGILKDFLKQRRSEVVKVLELDYTFDQQILLERKDAREEGRAEGHAAGHAAGTAEERGKLKDAFRALKLGKTKEELLAEGYSEATIESALEMINM